jgi:TPR repeat protein
MAKLGSVFVILAILIACSPSQTELPHAKDDRSAGQIAYDGGDYELAFGEWSTLAEQGDAAAQKEIGLMYAKGQGVVQSDEEALKWFHKAADQGFAEAQNNIGVMYAKGRGVSQDPEEAAKWYRKAAENGAAVAQFNLGVTYLEGKGVPQNDAEAINWILKAADQGNVEAREFLAQFHKPAEIEAPIEEDVDFKFTRGTAEWFSPLAIFSDDSDLGARYLVIKGELENTNSAEVMQNVQCVAQLTIVFENGKSVQIESEDICSDAGIGAVSAMLGDPTLAAMGSSLVIAPGKSSRIDTSNGGSIMSNLRGPTVPGKYKPYPVQSTQLTITLVAKTAFGDPVRETIFDSVIPNSSHGAKFDL